MISSSKIVPKLLLDNGKLLYTQKYIENRRMFIGYILSALRNDFKIPSNRKIDYIKDPSHPLPSD